MAAAQIEVDVPNLALMMAAPPAPHQQMDKLKIQNLYLACMVTREMLKLENMNGLHRLHDSRRFTHEVINEPEFKEAVATVMKCCQYLKEKKESEMWGLVSDLDISDAQLYANYQRIAERLMAEDIRFGRIGSLFFFTFLLCKRLHIEGRQREIESVVDWLTRFLDDRISPWLIKNHSGKWAGIIEGIKMEPPPQRTSMKAGGGSGWMTMAALGVGAFVVGALAIR